MSEILKGIKVLDLTRIVAGPLCTQYLCDAGATVYKIERPEEGDDTRRMGPYLEGREHDINAASVFLAYNRGKKSVTVDIAHPEGAKLVRELARQCDVVVENFKAGALKKYNLDYESIKEINPSIVYCSLSGFGQEGPYASHAAYDFILQGMAGMMSTCGHPDEKAGGGPMRTAIPITDIVTGLTSNISIMYALFHRLKTGEGQYIDGSLLDSSVALNGHLGVSYLTTGQEPKRLGNQNPIAAPSQVFECADGHLIIAAGNTKQFTALCEVLDLTLLLEDERFATNTSRIEHRELLNDYIHEKVISRTRKDLLSQFSQAGVPSGPINKMQDVFEDPQVKYRGLAVEVPYENDTSLSLLRSPFRFSKTPVTHKAPPTLGEHTNEVLQEILKIDNEKLEELKAQGII